MTCSSTCCAMSTIAGPANTCGHKMLVLVLSEQRDGAVKNLWSVPTLVLEHETVASEASHCLSVCWGVTQLLLATYPLITLTTAT